MERQAPIAQRTIGYTNSCGISSNMIDLLSIAYSAMKHGESSVLC